MAAALRDLPLRNNLSRIAASLADALGPWHGGHAQDPPAGRRCLCPGRALGSAALEVLAHHVGLINTFLDTACTREQRQQWMDAEWKAMSSGSGAAAIPDRVVAHWPVPLVVFVAHCVHRGSTWKVWDRAEPPDLFEVVRQQAARVPRQKDPRQLTLLSATTFRSFAGGLLVEALKRSAGGAPAPLPDDWSTAHEKAVAFPTGPANQLFQLIEPDDVAGP